MANRDEFGLTPKQRLFADEYIANKGNATDAARKAGYRQPKASGLENLEKPTIQKYIKSRTEPILEELKISGDDVVREIASIAFGKVQEGYSKKTNLMTNEVESEMRYEHTADVENRLKALEILGRHLQLFTDKSEVQLSGIVTFVDDVPLEDDDG
ncbi:terminase small subunit [Streptococcus sp. E17BB]|uniref:terminase small subunit n=1 Tax=Streptococcus sp. E17BB TaxID=3278714 RepID=UPI00359DCD1B